MYDELVKRLWECASGECFNCSQYTPTTNASVCQEELMKQAADAIEELQAQLMYSNDAAKAIAEKVPKWIPVTERLPKEQETVLAFGTLGVAWLDWRHDNKWCCYGGVTHWMPLPELPKEET